MTKARLLKVETLVRKYTDKHGNSDQEKIIQRMKDAHSRGMILSKDGKTELTPKEWLKTLPPYLAEMITKVVEKQEQQEKQKQKTTVSESVSVCVGAVSVSSPDAY